jgi:hypothetical protein
MGQKNDNTFKKRNRRLVENKQQPLVESANNRLIQISPNKITHQVSQNNVKQTYLLLKPTHNIIIDDDIDK